MNKNLVTFKRAVTWIRQNIDPEMGIQKVELLLLIAETEGIGQQGLMQMTGLSSGSISRHLMRMGVYFDNRAKRERGLGLTLQTPDPINRRQNSVYLTDKGKQVMKQLKEVLNA